MDDSGDKSQFINFLLSELEVVLQKKPELTAENIQPCHKWPNYISAIRCVLNKNRFGIIGKVTSVKPLNPLSPGSGYALTGILDHVGKPESLGESAVMSVVINSIDAEYINV